MATTTHDETDAAANHTDAQAAFIDRVAAKYEKEDQAASEQEDGVEAATEEEDTEEPDDSTEEHPDEGTSADDPDGDAAEPGEDSPDDDAAEHPDGEEPADSPDDPDADDGEPEGEEPDEEEAPAIDATAAALAARGADLKLEDIPAEYQGPVKAKLRSIDAAFTRVQQEATSFRTERARFVAEERFRAENPELALTEAIQQALEKDPDIFDKINARFEKLDDADQAAAFKIVLQDKRQQTVKAVESEVSKIDAQWQRAEHVESTARKLATTSGLPWRLAERAVEAALLRKPEHARDLSDDELATIIRAEAKEHQAESRATKRTASRELVQERTKARTASAPASGRRPASSAAPRPAARRPAPVDHSSEESRQRRMMETARRVMPGVKD